MVRKDNDYTHVFFMVVGSFDYEDEDDVRFRQKLYSSAIDKGNYG